MERKPIETYRGMKIYPAGGGAVFWYDPRADYRSLHYPTIEAAKAYIDHEKTLPLTDVQKKAYGTVPHP